jgi:hypothetical protein
MAMTLSHQPEVLARGEGGGVAQRKVHMCHRACSDFGQQSVVMVVMVTINYLECSIIHFLQQNRLSSDVTMAT